MSASGLSILFLADPSSIHDVKWMMPDGPPIERYLLIRKCHLEQFELGEVIAWCERHGFHYAGAIGDFSIVRFWRTYKEFLALRKLIKEKSIDILHIFFAEPNALWAVFRSLLSVPIVVSTRGTDVLKTIPSFFRRRDPLGFLSSILYRVAFRAVDAVTSTCSRQVKAVERIAGRSKPLLREVRTGVDLMKLERDLSGPAAESMLDGPFVLFPRLMRPIYNHEFAIKAVQALSDDIRSHHRFVFLDKNSSDREYVTEVERMMGEVDANFLFLPSLSQQALHRWMGQAKAVVMTPRSDGTPVSGAESMLLETPLILPPLDYDQTLFEGAFFFPDWQPESLSRTLEMVLNGHWEDRLSAARDSAEALFSRKEQMKEVWDIYEILVGHKVQRFPEFALEPETEVKTVCRK